MTVEFKVDEQGYIYLFDQQRGNRHYLLVEVPNCAHYGKVKMGNPGEEAEDSHE